jgi:predicted transcriptional regulator
MARTGQPHPTDGELAILRVLWRSGPARLSAICEALGVQRKVAPTTVATMLKIMKRKGQVKRTAGAEGIRWQAMLSQKEAGSSLLANLVNRVFEGSAQKVVLHLLDQGHLSADDQEEIRRLLSARTGKSRS